MSPAFDKVSAKRLLKKLERYGVRGKRLAFLKSWLEKRVAVVVLNGSQSDEANLTDMVYQGTVLGPPLWNTFFADVALVVRDCDFYEILFADDLNCYTDFEAEADNEDLKEELRQCQTAVHEWGKASQVECDSLKKSFHVLHRRDPAGESFRVFGVRWNIKLSMEPECEEVGKRAFTKLRALLKLRRFYTTPQLVQLYKTHVLPVLELPTPAVYHATDTALDNLDKVQRHFLRELGLTAAEALEKFHLAPLSTRRDVALLGLVHRTVLGEGLPHFAKWFFPCRRLRHSYRTRLQEGRHSKQLHDWLDSDHTELLKRSPLGLPRVYNKLPQSVVNADTVRSLSLIHISEPTRQEASA